MSTQQSAYTYFGLWINWSHGMIRGSTLTLSSRDGSLLTAFLALFVAVAGSALWRIVAFLFHQLGARRGRKDGMHHQQQVILRNTGSPGSALWQFTQLVYYWWQPAERPVWRSLPFLVLALLSLAVLSVTSLFSSQITRASGAETLIISNNCGFWVPDVDSVEQSNRAFAHKTLRDSTSAASYAQACYGSNPDTLQCNQYVQRQIKWTANQNATCPFGSGICMISDTAAYEMDSGLIDSHVHLGINTPKKNRITYRKRTTCAALNKDDYFTTKNATETTTPEGGFFGQPGDVINFYNFGSFEGLNYTFFYNTHAAIDGHGYDLTYVITCLYSVTADGS